MQKPDLEIINVNTQDDLKNLRGRSLIADVTAKDNENTYYNIEVERSSSGANPREMRYHSSMLDASILKPGEETTKLPETYVIYLIEDDIEKAGQPYYPIESFKKVNNEWISFNDGRHLIEVNGLYEGDNDFGRLMKDLKEKNPENINFPILKELVGHYKNNKEERNKMHNALDDLIDDLIKEENERAEERVKRETEERVKKETEERVKKETEERVKKETEQQNKEKEKKLASEMFLDGLEINQIAKYCKILTQGELTDIQAEVLNPV